MGGFGSGRHSGRPTLDSRQRLDVRWMHRQGYLRPGVSGTLRWSCRGVETGLIQYGSEGNRLVLNYKVRDEGESDWRPYTYAVTVEWLPCHFGGHRPLLLCPRCGRRVAVLYGGEIFVCRRCTGLSYQSQRESAAGRAQLHAETLRERLGWTPGLLELEGGKPKGMHWATYERLTALHRAYAGITLAEWDRWGEKLRAAGLNEEADKLSDWRP